MFLMVATTGLARGPRPAGCLNLVQCAEPIAYKWNEHISLLPRPVPHELVKYTLGSESLWRCYVVVGDLLERIEEEVNQWVDELDMVDSGFDGVIRMVFLSSEAAILTFEPQGELVDFFYEQRCADWVVEK